MKRERRSFYLNILAAVRRIRPAKLIYWPMSLAGLLAFGERTEVKVIAPTNIVVSVVSTALPVPLTVVAPSNIVVQVIQTPSSIPPWVVKTNMCEIPISFVTSGSITDVGGAHMTFYKNVTFRRTAKNTYESKAKAAK